MAEALPNTQTRVMETGNEEITRRLRRVIITAWVSISPTVSFG